jgi:hypothetical protein
MEARWTARSKKEFWQKKANFAVRFLGVGAYLGAQGKN